MRGFVSALIAPPHVDVERVETDRAVGEYRTRRRRSAFVSGCALHSIPRITERLSCDTTSNPTQRRIVRFPPLVEWVLSVCSISLWLSEVLTLLLTNTSLPGLSSTKCSLLFSYNTKKMSDRTYTTNGFVSKANSLKSEQSTSKRFVYI